MSKVLVIGAGGVGSVAVHKMAMNPDIFPDITLASRRKFKCDAIAESVKERTGVTINTAEVDADHIDATAALIRSIGATHVVNLALPYQDLTIMERSEEHTSELQSLMRISYAVFCFNKKKIQ